MAERPPLPSSAPPLEALIEESELEEVSSNLDEAAFNFQLEGYYHLPITHVTPTWQHKLYWFLRKCIDWIHP